METGRLLRGDFLQFMGRREVLVSLLLQTVLGLFLAHGYDFRVNYVAGRNVVNGLSPYEGGFVDGALAVAYGNYVQGIGETPLWALYTGIAYFLSSGQIFVFNFLLKIPIIAANIFLSYLSWKNNGDYRFFLFNPFLLLVSTMWGKPDNVATLLALLALLAGNKSLTLSASLNLKPLAVALIPSFLAAWMQNKKTMFYTVMFSTLMFFGPFIVFRWPVEIVINGFGNWFKPAGGISMFNFVEYVYGAAVLPRTFEPFGYLPAFAVLLTSILGLVFPPRNMDGVMRLGLISASLFFTVRPWVSEQNLVLPLILMMFIRVRLPSPLLWIIPSVFAVVNLAVFQQFYLLWPAGFEIFAAFDHPTRLLAKFVVAVTWWTFLWYVIWRENLWKWWR